MAEPRDQHFASGVATERRYSGTSGDAIIPCVRGEHSYYAGAGVIAVPFVAGLDSRGHVVYKLFFGIYLHI